MTPARVWGAQRLVILRGHAAGRGGAVGRAWCGGVALTTHRVSHSLSRESHVRHTFMTRDNTHKLPM